MHGRSTISREIDSIIHAQALQIMAPNDVHVSSTGGSGEDDMSSRSDDDFDDNDCIIVPTCPGTVSALHHCS